MTVVVFDLIVMYSFVHVMGGSSSRPNTYEQYYRSLQNGGISLDNVDPYEVLGVTKNFEWDDLTQAYRKMARMVHPDKGPPHEAEVRGRMFKTLTECFKHLAIEYKRRLENRNHADLKSEAQAYYRSNPQYSGGAQGVGADESFLDRFNRTFEENKIEDENAIGYGNLMAASSKTREDISVPQVLKKYSRDTFNSVFDRMTLSQTKDVVVYKEPEALPLAKKVAYTELGGDRPDDFSSTREGTRSKLDYTDYMKATTQSRLVDPRAVQERKEYKNVDAYEKERNKVMKKPLTPDEMAWRAQKERDAKRAEEARLQRLRERDELASAHHDKMNRLMLSSGRI